MHFTVPSRPNERFCVPAIAELVPAAAANRTALNTASVSIGGVPLAEFRAGLRRCVLELTKRAPDDERPVIASGHQPGFPHPGVLYKHAVLDQLASEAVCINVVVDSDATEVLSIKVPVRQKDHVALTELLMAHTERRMVLGCAPKPERRAFEAQISEVRRAAAKLGSDEILKGLDRFAAIHREEYADHATLAELLTAYRRRYFTTPRVHEVFLSSLCDTDEFRAFAAALIEDAPAFATTHNATLAEYRRTRRIRTAVNPFPDLRHDAQRTEVPLWHVDPSGLRSPVYAARSGKRTTVYAHDTAVGEFATRAQRDRLLKALVLRPRALTLSLFMRLGAADLFIHGVGGGNYDMATDAILRAYFGLEPPVYAVASATVRLPIEFDDGLDQRCRELVYRARRMTWNPDEFVPKSNPLRQEKAQILLTAGGRLTRDGHERIEAIRRELLETVASQRQENDAALETARAALADQRRLASRDFPYFLYPLPRLVAAMQEPQTTTTG
ncbi:MAG: hypothetical protein JW889_13335 [Verrucomicrobia bacterium]|nr:hypothetical protein [Verrucomicrobiota bacterium]